MANGQGTVLNYELTEGENTTNGTFYTGEGHETFFTPDYVSIYPAFNAEGTANAITSSTEATFNLPATQTYKENSFAEKSMPMVAYSSTQTLNFKNVLGGICFPIVCTSPVQVTSVVLTSAADEALWGTCTTTISTSGGDPTSQVTNSDAAKNVITLDCSGSNVTLNPDEPTYFCIMVPPGSLASGFTLQAYSGETKVFEKSNTDQLGADFIPRSVIRKVNHNLDIVVTTLTVTTISPTFITKNSALGLGAINNTPVSCGILYALASDLATPADDLVVGGTNVTNLSGTAGTRFDASLTGLAEDQIYYVRAYATNEVGAVSYGDPVPFATRYDYYSADNKGKSRSVFSVRDNTRVRFSMGNLQYIGSEGSGNAADNNAGAYWKFADYQFDYFGDNGQASTTIKQDRDLFGWGTSGINDYSPRATCWQPWSTSTRDDDYWPYDNKRSCLYSSTGEADWGYNAISNGGNTVNSGWRTLQAGYEDGTNREWLYLLDTRNFDYRYTQVQLTLKGTSDMSYTTVNQVPACGTTVNGLIVFPDSFTWPATVNALTKLNAADSWGLTNNLTEAQWSLLEKQGAVFLPAAGSRRGTEFPLNYLDLVGLYWSSSRYSNDEAWELFFFSNSVTPESALGYRSNAFSVRLVCPE